MHRPYHLPIGNYFVGELTAYLVGWLAAPPAWLPKGREPEDTVPVHAVVLGANRVYSVDNGGRRDESRSITPNADTKTFSGLGMRRCASGWTRCSSSSRGRRASIW